jgi:polysaccharide biosynthesis protein PslH
LALKVLMILHRIPHPLNDGGAIGVHYLIKGYLQQGVHLNIITLNTSKHYVAKEQMPQWVQECNSFTDVYVDTQIKPWPAFKALLQNKSYHITRFDTVAMHEAISQCLSNNTFDIIQLDNIYLAPYLPTIKQHCTTPIVCRIHNIEHYIWQLNAHQARGIKAWYIGKLAKQLKQAELHLLQQCQALLCINTDEAEQLKALGITTPTHWLPFGIDTYKVVNEQVTYEPSNIFFIGSMDWLPNVQGMQWFINKVWPLILKEIPYAQLHIAGKHMPASITQYNTLHNIIIHGQVPDAMQFIQQYTTMIVPLHSGAGIRIKILEAMALGKLVISTSLGAQGLMLQNGINTIIVDDAINMSKAIINSMHQYPKLIAAKGSQHVVAYFDSAKIFTQAIKYLTNLAQHAR